eukprot:g16168.t1
MSSTETESATVGMKRKEPEMDQPDQSDNQYQLQPTDVQPADDENNQPTQNSETQTENPPEKSTEEVVKSETAGENVVVTTEASSSDSTSSEASSSDPNSSANQAPPSSPSDPIKNLKVAIPPQGKRTFEFPPPSESPTPFSPQHKKRRKKASVSWAPNTELVKVHTFSLNAPPNPALADGSQANQAEEEEAKDLSDLEMHASLHWFEAPAIELPHEIMDIKQQLPSTTPDSMAQVEREKTILPPPYLTPKDIPDSPYEDPALIAEASRITIAPEVPWAGPKEDNPPVATSSAPATSQVAPVATTAAAASNAPTAVPAPVPSSVSAAASVPLATAPPPAVSPAQASASTPTAAPKQAAAPVEAVPTDVSSMLDLLVSNPNIDQLLTTLAAPATSPSAAAIPPPPTPPVPPSGGPPHQQVPAGPNHRPGAAYPPQIAAPLPPAEAPRYRDREPGYAGRPQSPPSYYPPGYDRERDLYDRERAAYGGRSPPPGRRSPAGEDWRERERRERDLDRRGPPGYYRDERRWREGERRLSPPPMRRPDSPPPSYYDRERLPLSPQRRLSREELYERERGPRRYSLSPPPYRRRISDRDLRERDLRERELRGLPPRERDPYRRSPPREYDREYDREFEARRRAPSPPRAPAGPPRRPRLGGPRAEAGPPLGTMAGGPQRKPPQPKYVAEPEQPTSEEITRKEEVRWRAYKTKPCVYHTTTGCRFGATCNFWHDGEQGSGGVDLQNLPPQGGPPPQAPQPPPNMQQPPPNGMGPAGGNVYPY